MAWSVVSLREFTEGAIPDARGYVYLWSSRPFLQLHLFEEEYTLFWLGSAELGKLVDGFLDITLADERLLQEHGYAATRLWSVTVDQVVGLQSGKAQPQELRQFQGSWSVIRDQLTDMRAADNSLTSFISGGSPPYRIKLWAESAHSRNDNKDVGITSNFPTINPIRELFRRTLLEEVPREELQGLFDRIDTETWPYFTRKKGSA